MPNFRYENLHGRKTGKIICGVDEVGRGPLAGPVMAAAAIIPVIFDKKLSAKIHDSKKMSHEQREEIFPDLIKLCRFAIAEATVQEITDINILQASLLAMRRAVEGLQTQIDMALVDGNRAPKLACPVETIVQGDDKSLSIAVASIIAKVTRDRLMKKLAEEHPGYGWERNAGYGTPEHMDALKRLGITVWHRCSFAPIAQLSAAID